MAKFGHFWDFFQSQFSRFLRSKACSYFNGDRFGIHTGDLLKKTAFEGVRNLHTNISSFSELWFFSKNLHSLERSTWGVGETSSFAINGSRYYFRRYLLSVMLKWSICECSNRSLYEHTLLVMKRKCPQMLASPVQISTMYRAVHMQSSRKMEEYLKI